MPVLDFSEKDELGDLVDEFNPIIPNFSDKVDQVVMEISQTDRIIERDPQ